MNEVVTSSARVEYSEITESIRDLSSLPQHFHDDASELVKLLEAYYRYLNKKYIPNIQSSGPTRELNNIMINHDIDSVTDDRYLDAIEKLIGSYIPPSRAIDRIKLYKIIANYYTNRGSEEGIHSFFRLFFNEIVYLFYPKKLLFTTSDSERSKTSDIYRLSDNKRWQNYSYVIYSNLNKVNWGDEYTKYIHPAGLKFFVAIILELIHNNNWFDIGCLNIDWSEFPNNFLNDAYSKEGSSEIYYFDDPEDYYYYYESVINDLKINTVVDENCWRSIDWKTAIGKHTPSNQSASYLSKLKIIIPNIDDDIDGDIFIPYQIHPKILKKFLRRLFVTYGLIIENDNTPFSTFRKQSWNGYDKSIDSGIIGEYSDVLLSDIVSPSQGLGPQFNTLNSYIVFDGNYNSAYLFDDVFSYAIITNDQLIATVENVQYTVETDWKIYQNDVHIATINSVTAQQNGDWRYAYTLTNSNIKIDYSSDLIIESPLSTILNPIEYILISRAYELEETSDGALTTGDNNLTSAFSGFPPNNNNLVTFP